MAVKYVRMVSEAQHIYAGKRLEPGDEFDCEPKHVSFMKALGRARLIVNGTLRGQTYETRVMTARKGKSIQ